MGPRSELMTYIGYESGTKGYKFMWVSNTIFIGAMTTFDQNLFPHCPIAQTPCITNSDDEQPEDPGNGSHKFPGSTGSRSWLGQWPWPLSSPMHIKSLMSGTRLRLVIQHHGSTSRMAHHMWCQWLYHTHHWCHLTLLAFLLHHILVCSPVIPQMFHPQILQVYNGPLPADKVWNSPTDWPMAMCSMCETRQHALSATGVKTSVYSIHSIKLILTNLSLQRSYWGRARKQLGRRRRMRVWPREGWKRCRFLHSPPCSW